MKKGFIVTAMWYIFENSFEKNLPILGINEKERVIKNARKKYFQIIDTVQPFGKNDVLLINILSAAGLAAVYLSLEKKPEIEQLAEYYDSSMSSNTVMRAFLKGNNYYSNRYQKSLSKAAQKSQLSDNPYSWRFKYYPGETIDSFNAIFDKCGICHLYSELGIFDIVPALCKFDYGMAKFSSTEFTREFTLASGGEVCDCHYKNIKSK